MPEGRHTPNRHPQWAARLLELTKEIRHHLVKYAIVELGVPPAYAPQYAAAHWDEMLDEALPESMSEEYEYLRGVCSTEYYVDDLLALDNAAETRPAAATPARHKTGRPRKTDKGSTELVVAALRKHHGYEDGSVTNYEPAKNATLEKKYKLANNALTRFLAAKYPGERRPYRCYEVACRNRSIGAQLRLWSGELPMHATRLLPHDSGSADAD
jgi:hypothetical protein